MNKRIVAASWLIVTSVITTAASAAPVPCEQMLSKVKSALQTAKLSDGDRVKVTDLENKGAERCKADDDTRADDFFQQALALMGK